MAVGMISLDVFGFFSNGNSSNFLKSLFICLFVVSKLEFYFLDKKGALIGTQLLI